MRTERDWGEAESRIEGRSQLQPDAEMKCFQMLFLTSNSKEVLRMNFQIIGDSDCPLVQIRLNRGETVKVENGAMAYMQGVSLTGKMNSRKGGFGGVLGAIGRSLTSGESIFITQAVGDTDGGILGVAPAIPGKITSLPVGSSQYCLNTGAFLACDDTVSYRMVSQNIGKALFAGTGGLFVMESEGEGDLLVNAFGDIMELNVMPGKDILVDNDHVVAWDQSLDYRIEVASGAFGFTTGEGLVNRFSGSGKVLIQTRNIRSLAAEVNKYIPSDN